MRIDTSKNRRKLQADRPQNPNKRGPNPTLSLGVRKWSTVALMAIGARNEQTIWRYPARALAHIRCRSEQEFGSASFLLDRRLTSVGIQTSCHDVDRLPLGERR